MQAFSNKKQYMAKKQQFERLKKITVQFIAAVQAGAEDRDSAEARHVEDCVESAEALICWITFRITKDFQKENK